MTQQAMALEAQLQSEDLSSIPRTHLDHPGCHLILTNLLWLSYPSTNE